MFDRTMHLSTNWVRAKAHLGPASAGLVSAYIAGGHSFDGHRVNNPHRKHEIAMTGLSLPPSVVMTPHELWHWVDRKERRKDGEYQMRSRELPRLASHMRCSLPWSLSAEAAERVTIAFARFLTEEFGLGVQYAIHNKPGHDRDHAHFLMSTRSLAAANFGKKVRQLDGIATRKREAGTAAEVRYTGADGREKAISSTIETMRAHWAGLLSSELGFVVDHRSFERRGLDLDPVIYVPRSRIEYEKRQAKRGAAGLDWRAERVSQLAGRKIAGTIEVSGPDGDIRQRARREPVRVPDVADIGLRSICQALACRNTLGTSRPTIATALTRLAEISPLLALATGNQIVEAVDAREVHETGPVVAASSSISALETPERKREHPRQKAASGIMSQLIAQRGQDIASAVSASPSQQRIVRDAINDLGRTNPIVALGVLSRMEEIVLAPDMGADTAMSVSPAEKRVRARRQGNASGRKTVTGTMATRARQAFETELSLVERGHDDTDAANAAAAQLETEMKRRERRLRNQVARLGHAALQTAAIQQELIAFARVLETYLGKAISAVRERLAFHRLEKRKLAAQARLELVARDALPIDNAMVRLQATAAVAQSFHGSLESLHTRQAGEIAAEVKQWLSGGPNVQSLASAPKLDPTIVSSDWYRPSTQAATVEKTAQASPPAPSPRMGLPRAAPQRDQKNPQPSPRKQPRSRVVINVPAFTEREEFGLIGLRPASQPPANTIKVVGNPSATPGEDTACSGHSRPKRRPGSGQGIE